MVIEKPLLHVLFTPSGAGTLRQTLAQQGRAEQVACPFDDFSFGPVGTGDAARVAWVEEELGFTDWEGVVADTAPFLEASCSNDVLPVAWISRRDARSYAGFLWWLSHLGVAPCRIIDVTDLMVGGAGTDMAPWPAVSPAALVPEEMARLLDTQRDLGAVERGEHQDRWRQLLSDNAPLRVVDRDGSLTSAPISYFDPLLLSCATSAWQKMARIIGEALASFLDDGVHQTGDLVLYGRACVLAEGGSLEWRGDLSSMQACELRLPPSA